MCEYNDAPMHDDGACLFDTDGYTCSELYNCCDCGSTTNVIQCCNYCFSCNACDNCTADN